MNSDLLDKSTTSFSSSIEYTPVYKHILNTLKSRWKKILLTTIAVFSVSWTVINSSGYFLKIDFSGFNLFILLALLSIIFAFIHTIFIYISTPPPGLEGLPYDIQRIAILKKPFWEYRFAHDLLKFKLLEIDTYLNGIQKGQIYIEVTQRPTIKEYIDWFLLRPVNLLKMIEIIKNLLLKDLPACLINNNENKVYFEKIILCIENIKNLYQNACNYEIEGRKIEPPEVFSKIHKIQSGWSKEIRNGIVQALEFLTKIYTMDKKGLKHLSKDNPVYYRITFNEPEGLDEALEEIKKIERKLPELMFNETFRR
jgi:hypothetical protein